LVPVDTSEHIPIHADHSEFNEDELFKSSPYRLQTINHDLCMARKVDDKNPIPGTRPTDPGSNGRFYPEKQCSRKPIAGLKMCKICPGSSSFGIVKAAPPVTLITVA
jgi:hypothetical protein